MRVAWHALAEGDPSIASTLAEMQRQKLRALVDPNIVASARLIAREAAASRDTMKIAGAIFQWVQERFRYIPDPARYDLMMTPALMLREIAREGIVMEDCESVATLLATLLEAVGIPTRFHVVSQAMPITGDHGYSHVWVDAFITRQWVPFDATLPESRPGERPSTGITSEAVFTDRLIPVGLGRPPMYYATTPQRRTSRMHGIGLGFLGQDAVSVPTSDIFSESVPSPTGPPIAPSASDIFAPEPTAAEGMTYPTSPSGSSPTFPGAPNPDQPSRSTSPIDWTSIFKSAGQAGATVLPLLERYGALRPAPTQVAPPKPGTVATPKLGLPAFIQYPNLPFAGNYAQALGVTPQGLSQVVVWGGLGIVGFMILRRVLS